jgi:hypothetical protein
MSLEPIKIPQNVYIEDRIVGPITLKQIIMLGIGGGISYSIWGIVAQAKGGSAPLPVTIICSIPFIISAAFAFVKVNDLSLMRIGFLMLERLNKPAVRTFSPRRGFSIHIRTFDDVPRTHQPLSPEKQQNQRHLDALTEILDQNTMRRELAPKASEPIMSDEAELPVRDMAAEVPEAETAQTTILPVNRDRIKANPLAGEDGKEPRASVSIFRDLVVK